MKPVASSPVTVLFSSAGRRNQLMNCFRADAARLGLGLRVLAADAQPELSSACHSANLACQVPRCTDGGFIPALLEICRTNSVHLLVPTIDPELAVLSRHREEFIAVGTRVVVSDDTVVALANDKLTAMKRLQQAGIPTPATMTLDDYLRNPDQLRWPVIAKPNSGSASVGIVRPRNRKELALLPPHPDMIVQEFVAGEEYTVNVFFDQDGHLRCAVPHRRIEVRHGEVAKGRTERMPQLLAAARKLEPCLRGAAGPLCFQAVVTPAGEFAVIEINARFGGGYPLAHRAGAHFSQWLLEEVTGQPCSAHDKWREGVTMLRYDSAVFLEP